jgi:apolipoprotein N-acyltransferase
MGRCQLKQGEYLWLSIPNKFLTLSVIILLAALCYLLVKVHAPRFLIAASFGFVAGMYVNIFSWLIQFDVLNNSFTVVNVVLIVFILSQFSDRAIIL